MRAMDQQGVLSGQPLQWIVSDLLTTFWVAPASIIFAMLIAILSLDLRLTSNRPAKTTAGVQVSMSHSTPLLAQLVFRYFAVWNWPPRDVINSINADHPWLILPGDAWWLTPELICSAWGLGVFTSTFPIEEVASGLQAVSVGQREAAVAQGFSSWAIFRHILPPQELASARRPIVGQYLNLLELSLLVSGIGFAELTYQVWQIENYNAHASEAFAADTVLYLSTSIVLDMLLIHLGPQPASGKSSKIRIRILSIRSILHDR